MKASRISSTEARSKVRCKHGEVQVRNAGAGDLLHLGLSTRARLVQPRIRNKKDLLSHMVLVFKCMLGVEGFATPLTKTAMENR